MTVDFKEYSRRMDKALEHLDEEFASVRAGRANAKVLDRITVEYYGSETPLNGVATISAHDARTLIIQPWDTKLLKDIQKAIQTSDLGINPQNDGRVIRLVFPQLTEERRKDLAKQVKKYSEEAKVAMRNIRRDGMDYVKKLKKNSEITEDDQKKAEKGVKLDVELDVDDMKDLVNRFKAFYKEEKGEDFPTDPKVQLMEAVKAVFRSWDNPRANVYRRMNEIPYDWGTAVNVQAMVFGNSGSKSGTGVAFTRNPATGEKALFGEYLINAQGEDVVAGVRTPSPISQLKEDMPEVYDQFAAIADRLEKHYKDMQDMEFTIENGKLYMLQLSLIHI